MGLPLARRKGSCGAGPHRWIGAIFTARPISEASEALRAQVGDVDHYVVVSVPDDFIATLTCDLKLFLNGTGHVSDDDVQRTIGRCGRLAYLVPAARPFVSALWAALGAAELSAQQGRREAPPGRVPAQMFQAAARCIFRLLHPPSRELPWLPLEHVITERLGDISLSTAAIAEVDASPWGGCGVLFIVGQIVEHWSLPWQPTDAKELQTTVGKPAGQTTWELLALLVTLVLWGRSHRGHGIALLGDNTASLQAALQLRGRGALARIAREISWRRARDGWRYAVGHLPSERNVLADSLSRLHAPSAEHKCLPPELAGALTREAPEIASLRVV